MKKNPAPFFETFQTTLRKEVSLPYLKVLPKGNAKEEPLPLLLFLHGMAERGEDLDLLQHTGLPKLLKEGLELPFLIIAPQCPTGSLWTEETEALKALLDHILETHPVDLQRIYITGLSMGGFGTMDMVLRYPDLFAAAIPICGGIGSLYGRMHLSKIKKLPLWLFHGGKDTVVLPKESDAIYQALKALGSRKVKHTLYKDLAHDSWSKTYENPKIYTYLLRHKKSLSRLR